MLSPRAEAQLAVMRAEIQRYAQSIVACDTLLVFVSATDPIHAQFGHIFTMAEREGWSVEFRPDGTVRFAELPPPVEQIGERRDAEPNINQTG
jgi:hypothetical protein